VPEPQSAPAGQPRALVRAAILLIGLVLPQVVLFGPSLVGRKILLPLDLLALPNYYLPPTPQYRSAVPQDAVQTDQVLAYEPARRFAAAEVRAGRLPVWTPYSFAGAPVAFATYSPFNLLYYCFASSVALAWIQLSLALVAGWGAYVCFRRVLGVGFWPAASGAWCYPLSGFFVLWQGHPIPTVIAWYPWALAATDAVVRRPRGWGGPALAAVTGLTLVSGGSDIAGEVLLGCGLYALWCLGATYGKRLLGRPGLTAAAATAGAWAIGFCLAMPYLLPLVEYASTGSRAARRAAGAEERPPVGLTALPQTVLPDVYGSTQRGSVYLAPGNLPEGAAAAYTGLLATLVAAPLAWCSRRHRALNLFWVVQGFIALAWVLDVPGLVDLMRLPGLNMLSYNRFTFVAAFAVLALAVTGLDAVWARLPDRRRWFVVPAAVLLALGLWCLYRSAVPPLEMAATFRTLHMRPSAAQRVLAGFKTSQAASAALCLLGVFAWAVIARAERPSRWPGPALAAVLVGELLWFAHGRSQQSDPSLYYPPVPALEQLSRAPPGRILGILCLPPRLSEVVRLRDVRGYDGVDPRRLVELLRPVQDTRFAGNDYAVTQWYVPKGVLNQDRPFTLPPVLSMLGVRYLLFRGPMPSKARPVFSGEDYWVIENPAALPRVSVPRRVRAVPEPDRTLALLSAADFDPKQVAYVEEPLDLPDDCRGTARITDEVPTRLAVSVDMQTPGLLLLSDLWYEGWQATLEGRPVPILRVNHALRGVVVPVGRGTVEFRYEQPGLAAGLKAAAAGLAALLLWAALIVWLARRARASAADSVVPRA
jgi:hypothetical protein